MSAEKNGRLPDSFWHTVNRPTREMGTGVLPGPTRADCGNSLLRAGAPKDSNIPGRRSSVNPRGSANKEAFAS